ncbi:hypothetical protein E2P71_05200 [Candidatus Bathyarchaeota archaeon]|nr:hypothetical protein E2P71_05200 [Candidatus Bathyarchaeota archaeon]
MKNNKTQNLIRGALTEGRSFLYEHESKEIITLYGVPTTKQILARNEGEAEAAADKIGYPVVLKVVSPQVLHKSDVGAVLLGLKNGIAVREGYQKIINGVKSRVPDAEVLGVLVQEMARPSTEVIVGALRDPQFGPTVMFGIGGVFTEIIRDVSFRVAPLTLKEAGEMVAEIKYRKILEGVRGNPAVDVPALTEILVKTSQIMVDYPEINAIDLNPVLAYEKGAMVVDARFILSEEVKAAEPQDRLTPRELLEPKSVAVIGASSNPEKIGHKILRNIVDAGFKGSIYPINPRDAEIIGLKCYKSVLDVQGDVDAAVVVVPAAHVLQVVKECVEKKVKGAIIISSGFKDIGSDGAKMEADILKAAREGGLRIIGPNCQGVSNPKAGFCATWPLVEAVGDVAVISQSGTIALEVPSYLSGNGLGYSKAIALGNKSDIDEADLISWLSGDDDTRVIAVYTEGMKNGVKLMKAVQRASAEKPVLILKGGKTEMGKRAVLAHTGSLAGNKEVFEAAIRQGGGVSVNNLEELCDAAKAFSMLQSPKGNKLLIVTSSGGSGILASDECEHVGLTLTKLHESTVRGLRDSLPSWCVVGNPIDLTGNAMNNVTLYRDSLEIALEDESVDMVLVIFGDPITQTWDTLKSVASKAATLGIPLAVAYLGGAEVQIVETKTLQENGIPVYPTPGRAVNALGYLNVYRRIMSRLNG